MEEPYLQKLDLLRMLIVRLERLSVDSHWARRAGGLRGMLIHWAEELEKGNKIDKAQLDLAIGLGFEILKRAAQEIPEEKRR